MHGTGKNHYALDLLARGYAVEIVSPDKIPDNFADLELRVDASPGDRLIASVVIRRSPEPREATHSARRKRGGQISLKIVIREAVVVKEETLLVGSPHNLGAQGFADDSRRPLHYPMSGAASGSGARLLNQVGFQWPANRPGSEPTQSSS